MKTIQQQLKRINKKLEKIISNYIENATGAFFPKQKNNNSTEEDDDDPVLFI
ncbi:hypothetical protein [Wenyingzhuangia sp. IMCC45574]